MAFRYKPGPLIDLCLEYIGRPGQTPNLLSPKRGFPERERARLQRFVSGIRILTTHKDETGKTSKTPRVVKKISAYGAAELMFKMRDGAQISVAGYFKQTGNTLKFPDLPCVEVGSGALLPLELCVVPKGQIMRKQVPPELTKNVLEFATKRPGDRLNSIQNGLGVLSYGQSEYVKQFGMHIDPRPAPLKVQARLLTPPTLRYGQGSRQAAIVCLITVASWSCND